jgi:hypothetical protein
MICSDLDAKGKARPAGVLIVVVGVEVKGHRVREPAGASVNDMHVFNASRASRPVESREE